MNIEEQKKVGYAEEVKGGSYLSPSTFPFVSQQLKSFIRTVKPALYKCVDDLEKKHPFNTNISSIDDWNEFIRAINKISQEIEEFIRVNIERAEKECESQF